MTGGTFTWTYDVSAYKNILLKAMIDECRANTDWIDNNLVYCPVNYVTNKAGNQSTDRAYNGYNGNNGT